MKDLLWKMKSCSIILVGHSVGAFASRGAVHVNNSRAAIARYRILAHVDDPVLLSGHWIYRHLADVESRCQIVQRLRELFFVGRVFVNLLPHSLEVLFENRLLSLQLNMLIRRYADCRKNDHYGHHDDEFEQGEAGRISNCEFRIAKRFAIRNSKFEIRNSKFRTSHYQSLYLVPLSAWPSLLV